MTRAIKDFYSVLIAGIVTLVFVVFTGLLPHFGLLGSLEGFHFGVIISLLFSTYTALGTLQTIIIVVTIILLFLNTVLLVFYIKKKKRMGNAGLAPVGLSGVIASVFGIGCGSCGTVIGTSVLGIFGASGLLASLPLGGQELSVAGLIIFLLSIRYLLKKVNDPDICRI